MLRPRNPKTNDLISCDWFGVTLDGKSLKTPLGKNLAVPSHCLAWAIAAEWDAQHQTLQPAQMPLMTLTCTAMDQVTASADAYREQALRYLPTDTTCYWADPGEDRVLHRKQQQTWDGLHDYCETFLQSRPSLAMGTSEGVIMSRPRTLKQSGLPHPPELLENALEWVDTLDAWHLCALHSVTSESKSFLVGMAVILSNVDSSNPFYDLTRAVAASRVEEEFQIDCWGLVEGGHDYDRLNCSVQIHAARFLAASINIGGTLKYK
jgi:ATP synthase F1 complex assembly factor 2